MRRTPPASRGAASDIGPECAKRSVATDAQVRAVRTAPPNGDSSPSLRRRRAREHLLTAEFLARSGVARPFPPTGAAPRTDCACPKPACSPGAGARSHAMKGMLRVGLLLLLVLAVPCTTRATGRPYLGNGSCLSCHGSDLPVLPTRSCLSCHRGNMDFLEPAAGATAVDDPTLAMGAAAFGGALVLVATLLIAYRMRRRAATLAMAVALIPLAQADGPLPDGLRRPSEVSPGGARNTQDTATALPGGVLVARNTAADLIPILSPAGDAVLFTRRDEDTTGDGVVDVRDGQALFLLRRGQPQALRVTPYALDFAGAMARFSQDGSRFVVPVPTRDTDADGHLGFADRHGLAVFDGDGREVARLDAGERDLTDPFFAADATTVVAVEGRGLVAWEWSAGTRRTVLDPAPNGSFPRLAGWDSTRDAPLFTRGLSYRLVPRDADRKYEKAEDVPIETAASGGGAVVSPHGGGHRRGRVEMAHGDLALYLDERPDGSRRLCRLASTAEECIDTGPSFVLAAAPLVGGGAAYLAAERRGGEVELLLWDSSGARRSTGLRLRPGLLGLAGAERVALCAATDDAEHALILVEPSSGAVTRLGNGSDLWYNPITAGRAVGGVRVPRDTDGDGKTTPLDVGELWIVWEAP